MKTATATTGYAVFHFRFFMGFVTAPSIKVAKQRAAAAWPNKRLEVELSPANITRFGERLNANRTYQAKHTV